MALKIGRPTPRWYNGESVKKSGRRIMGRKPGLGRPTPKWTVMSKNGNMKSTDLDKILDILSGFFNEIH